MLLQVELAVWLNRDPCNQVQLEKFNPLSDSFTSNLLLAAALPLELGISLVLPASQQSWTVKTGLTFRALKILVFSCAQPSPPAHMFLRLDSEHCLWAQRKERKMQV